MNFSNILYTLRTEHNLSQKQLANLTIMSQGSICDYENNVAVPTSTNLIKLADFFRVTVDYLLGREQEDGRVVIKDISLPNDEQELLHYYRTLSKEQRQSLQLVIVNINILTN